MDLGDYKDSLALKSKVKDLNTFDTAVSYVDEGKYELAYKKQSEIKDLEEAEELLSHFTVVQKLRFFRIIQTDNFGTSNRHQENLASANCGNSD